LQESVIRHTQQKALVENMKALLAEKAAAYEAVQRDLTTAHQDLSDARDEACKACATTKQLAAKQADTSSAKKRAEKVGEALSGAQGRVGADKGHLEETRCDLLAAQNQLAAAEVAAARVSHLEEAVADFQSRELAAQAKQHEAEKRRHDAELAVAQAEGRAESAEVARCSLDASVTNLNQRCAELEVRHQLYAAGPQILYWLSWLFSAGGPLLTSLSVIYIGSPHLKHNPIKRGMSDLRPTRV
jgi:chromosome segregation ATPase